MNHEECLHLLAEHGIKPTSNRIIVVRALATTSSPLTLAELEARITTIDKSGIFRTLNLFHQHHLVHTLVDVAGGTRYELCHSHNPDEDDDLHVHFYCEHCHRTYCLDHIPVPLVDLPSQFYITSVNYTIKGTCPHCLRET